MGRGAWVEGGCKKNPDIPHSLSNPRYLSLTLASLCLALSLTDDWPPGAAVGQHASPARERDERSPTPRVSAAQTPPPIVLQVSRPNRPKTHASSHQKQPPTCRNPATHHPHGLLYKLEARIEPQFASSIAKSRARVSGFGKVELGSSLEGFGAWIAASWVDY